MNDEKKSKTDPGKSGDIQEEKELFSFRPREITDKKRIAEILAAVQTYPVPTRLRGEERKGVVLRSWDGITPLGKEVLLKAAFKATEFPFFRIHHSYKYTEESREIIEEYRRLGGDFYPGEDPDLARAKFNDAWDDKQFFGLFNNKHGEVASTCKIVKCPKCNGSGNEYYYEKIFSDARGDCPECSGTGRQGVHICKRCEGYGKIDYRASEKEKRSKDCKFCKGRGEVISMFVAKLGEANSLASHEDKVKSKKASEKINNYVEVNILEHDPKLHNYSIKFDWKLLKDETLKKASKTKKIKILYAEGSVLNSDEIDYSKWPFAKLEDAKRVYDVCFFCGKGGVGAGIDWRHQSDSKKHFKCFDEKISFVTGIGWVKIHYLKDSTWVNVLTGEINGCGLPHPTPYGRDKLVVEDFPPLYQKVIKEVLKKGIPKATHNPATQNQNERKIGGKGGASVSTSPKKRWKFVVLGILLGVFGAHLAYAKRWLLFLLLWAGFITGNVMSGDVKEQNKSDEMQAMVQTTQEPEQKQSDETGDKKEGGSNLIGNIGFAVWGLLWIGGTLFIKNDGKGNRM